MAYVPRSSFIPKETNPSIPAQMLRRRTVNVFNLIASLLLILSFVSAIGLYFYEQYLMGELEQSKAALDQASNSSDGEKIEEIRLYDNKLAVARTLLDNHISITRLLSEIEDSTKATVQFRTLEYTYDPGFDISLTLSGNTEDFASVALQKMQYLDDRFFSNYVVTDISTSESAAVQSGGKDTSSVQLNPQAKVGFSVEGHFKKEYVEYTGRDETGTADAAAVSTAIESTPPTNGGNDGSSTVNIPVMVPPNIVTPI